MTTAQPVATAQEGPRNPMRIRPGRHATIRFDGPAPERAQIVVEYRKRRRLLARECRPLPVGSTTVGIKTHPRASHISCWLQWDGRTIDVEWEVDMGRPAEPVGRYFIVVGAMKAGTTTLFNLLAQHPAICRTWVEVPGISFQKEINYFRSLYRKHHSALDYDWRFPFERDRHAWTLDVSPNYAKWPASKAVPRRIASLPGDVRLAYILREPVDRIESHLAHSLQFSGKPKGLGHCIRTSRYAMHLDSFVEHIPRENILLLDFEELRLRPAAVMTQICDFLGIETAVSHTVIHNRRGLDFRLPREQRSVLAEALRGDVERLISVYGFKPAENWLRDAR